MRITGDTTQLYSIIVQLYNELFKGQKHFIIQLTIQPNFNQMIMQDFLDLIEDAINDFEAVIEIEVVDNAQLL